MQVRYDNLGPDTDISKPEHFKSMFTLFQFSPMVLEFFRDNQSSAESLVTSLVKAHTDAIEKMREGDKPAVE